MAQINLVCVTPFQCNDLLYPLMAKLWVQYTSVRVKVYAQIDEERRVRAPFLLRSYFYLWLQEVEAGKKEEASPLTGNALLMLGTGTHLSVLQEKV